MTPVPEVEHVVGTVVAFAAGIRFKAVGLIWDLQWVYGLVLQEAVVCDWIWGQQLPHQLGCEPACTLSTWLGWADGFVSNQIFGLLFRRVFVLGAGQSIEMELLTVLDGDFSLVLGV